MSRGSNERTDLSPQTRSLWAKTSRKEMSYLWGSLAVHLADTAEVARLLWREWLAPSTRRLIANGMGLSDAEAEKVVVWLAGVHDIGKATPSFEGKVPERAELVCESGLVIGARQESLPHSFMGETILQEWLQSQGVEEVMAECCAVVVGAHHGICSTDDDLRHIRHRDAINKDGCLGDDAWRSVQNELLAWAHAHAGMEYGEGILEHCELPSKLQTLLIGLVIMADWIASNINLFPLEPNYLDWNQSTERAKSAWKLLRLPRPIAVEGIEQTDEGLFRQQFPTLSSHASLRPTQREAAAVARSMEEPGLIIVEDQMGGGKTEAAILAATILLHKFGCSGVAFMLPTQATSNAMFTRMETWLRQLISSCSQEQMQDIHLLHGKAELNDDFSTLPLWNESWMGDGPNENETIVVNQWFSGNKRGLLAPFVVGTVDQLLMAALNTKHVQLRHLGLSGKVVIIDEVHAYDVYMGEYLNRALKFLGDYRVPVILLSATLPSSRREEMLKAYRGELRIGRNRKRTLNGPPRLPSGAVVYPLVTTTLAKKRAASCYYAVDSVSQNKKVGIDIAPDDLVALSTTLETTLREGGCACVIRDTVRRAQETYAYLCDHLDVSVILMHSRFIATDRAANDQRICRLLGPNSSERPHSLVVVATQVIEQSLDVDFDFMVTDIAPIDLLVQRLGRLHRHKRGDCECERPVPVRNPRCTITGVDISNDAPPSFSQGVDSVYQPAVLLRTLSVLQPILATTKMIELPRDIAGLIEQVYEQSPTVPQAWDSAYGMAQEKEREDRARKRSSARDWLLGNTPLYSLRGWMRSRVDFMNENLGRASVRDSEESIEVVVIRDTGQGLELLPWVAETFEMDSQLGTGADIPEDEKARVAALCSVCLPPTMSAPYIAEQVIDALEKQAHFSGWQESRWLRGALPLVLNERGEARIGCGNREFLLRYTRERGLELI